MTAREHWQALEPLLLIFTESGALGFAGAVEWLACSDDELGGNSPAQWVEAGRDLDILFTLARRDAARLTQAHQP